MTCKMGINPLSVGCKLQKYVQTGVKITKETAENGIEITKEEAIWEYVCGGCFWYKDPTKDIKVVLDSLVDNEAKLQEERMKIEKAEQERKAAMVAEQPVQIDENGWATDKNGNRYRHPKHWTQATCKNCSRIIWVRVIRGRGESGPSHIPDKCECETSPRVPWDDKNHPKSGR